MPQDVGGGTSVAGLVGGPAYVARSLSPRIHNAAFAARGLDWIYVAFPVEEGFVAEAIRGLGAAGVRGLNVTTPHKLAAATAVDELRGLAARTGSVNTVEMGGAGLVGWNTDGDGLLELLASEGLKVEGAAALVVGAGAAARSTIAALAGAGAARLTVLVRQPQGARPGEPPRVEAAARELEPLAAPAGFRIAALEDPHDDLVREADLIIDATGAGWDPARPPPISPAAIRPECAVVDLVYRTTALIRQAEARGARALDGLGVLIHQAAMSFRIWTGVEPPLGAMGDAARLKALQDPAD